MIDRLLTFDPNKRITAEEALLHPWITGSKGAGPRNSTNLAPAIRKGYSSRGSLNGISILNRLYKASDSSEEEIRKSAEVKDLDIPA